ncbi:MAG: DUF1559 domain-containing protein [Phycisphaeraceae bacterium]
MRIKPRAFTLIEMLVVISIIALLIAILLPVLGSMRQSAKFMQCINHIKQFSIAQHAYTRDYDGYVVHPNWGEGSDGWLYAGPSTGGKNLQQMLEIRENGFLWQYMNREGSVYRCPADEGPFDPSEPGVPGPVRAISSYQFNGGLNDYGGLGQDTHSLDLFASDDIFMWETDATSSRVRYGFWNDGGNRPDEGLESRHVDGAPIGTMDGSADKITAEEFYDIALSQRRPNRLWLRY